jgi:hypothetical protein
VGRGRGEIRGLGRGEGWHSRVSDWLHRTILPVIN